MTPADSIPVPDPTERTEERLRREISGVEKSFAKDVDCINEVMVEKFTGLERELKNLAARTAEQKMDVKEAVGSAEWTRRPAHFYAGGGSVCENSTRSL